MASGMALLTSFLASLLVVGICHGFTTTTDDACFGVTCPPDRYCRKHPNNTASCVCNEACPFILRPVCGSDGKTYDNDCVLRVEACKTNTKISVVHEGKCPTDDTCFGTACPADRSCWLFRGNTSSCDCAIYCRYRLNTVCGSDGKTYNNECTLRIEACETGTNIRVVDRGICNSESPCSQVYCPRYSYCQLDENNRTKCSCWGACTREYQPVCGSDNKTYATECTFQFQACSNNASIRIAYEGECKKDSPCSRISCRYGKCEVGRNNTTRCVCPSFCPYVSDPVCGTNNITYENTCFLKKAKCETNGRIQLKRKGAC